jgi:hypothetical protein
VARSESKRQKRLAKQKAKRSEKRQQLTRQRNMGLAEQLGRFESAPVLDCLVNEGFEGAGLASIFIGRKAPSGELALAIFLVDLYFMGVKDCFGKIATPTEYRTQVERFREQGVRSMDAPSARKLIEDAIEFARSQGVSPHSDFRKFRPILNGIDPDEARETFEMGKDGKPLFIQGPGQSSAEAMRLLGRRQGLRGLHFSEVGSNEEDFDEFDFEEDSDEFDDD